MPGRSDEAIVLARYPFRERDLVVTLLTRRGGQVRVLARHARGARIARASALEPLAAIRLTYFERRSSELATLDDVSLVRSAFPLAAVPEAWAAGQIVAELALAFCPPGERLEAPYRLIDRCVAALLAGVSPAAVAAYASLWLLRLSGVLPELDRCGVCGGELPAGRLAFDVAEGVLICAGHRPRGAVERLSAGAAAWLAVALRRPVEEVGEPPGDASSWLVGLVQRFTGREVVSWRYLRTLQGTGDAGPGTG